VTKTLQFVALVLGLMFMNCTPVRAEDAPLLSSKRVSLAGGLNYEWRTTPLKNNSEPLLERHGEWTTGLYGAYNLTPHASLVASSVLGFDSRQLRHTVGLRIRFFQGVK
jgi:hypothetical protein